MIILLQTSSVVLHEKCGSRWDVELIQIGYLLILKTLGYCAAELAKERSRLMSATNWTKAHKFWSPLGTYLATVKLIDFSPGKNDLFTYSSQQSSRYTCEQPLFGVVLNIFDVHSGKVMRDFKGSANEFASGGAGGVSGVSWYFAKLGKNIISVYEAETFTLTDKNWSPADPSIALFAPKLGGANQPAKKNLFSVSDCKMYWQSYGYYLVVKVGYTLFRIKERDIMAFAWVPKGHRFAVIRGEASRTDINFYKLGVFQSSRRSKERMQMRYIGLLLPFILLAGLKHLNGQLELYNVDEYAATSVTFTHEMENGFNIWSFNGRSLYRHPRDHMPIRYEISLLFLCRPRPPFFLTAEKEEEIKYEIKDQDVSAQFSKQDREGSCKNHGNLGHEMLTNA
ncbi:hypothetical protein MKW92_014239 [Papaver armeniacum]|nr:hypothetical protein MKW92_014239 [Papaver armeniacum]